MTVPATDITFQYRQFREELDNALSAVLESGHFIGGPEVKAFEDQLAAYLHAGHVISCANGTDALRLALMALDLPRGSKIIVPAFTYIAPVEVIHLMGYEPVYCDVERATFNCSADMLSNAATDDVRAILPVHLFGQPCDREAIANWAAAKNYWVIEDNAQSIAAVKDISQTASLITTSFFPTKNLSCFGDGGAVFTNNTRIAARIKSLANHGQTQKKYFHEMTGINSRLDALQAAVLQVKLRHLDQFVAKRKSIAAFYDASLNDIAEIQIPQNKGLHTYHQYTLQVKDGQRDRLQQFLAGKNIPSFVYYPIPVYRQAAYRNDRISLPNTEKLCSTVLSLPMHTALDEGTLSYISEAVRLYFKK